MRGRIAALLVSELVLVALGLVAIDRQPAIGEPSTGLLLTFVVAMTGLAFLPQIYVEHRRHGAWITPADGAILVGLFVVGPLATVLAAMVAELLISVRFRQKPLKLVFNLVSMFGGYTAAAATFAVIGRTDPLDPLAWGAGLLALAACAAWDTCSTAALFSVLEQRRFRAVLRGIGPAVVASLVLSASLGLMALLLIHEHPFGVLLVAPVLALLVISTRSVAQAQTERTRLERLYGASSSLTRLTGRDETLAGIADHGRSLITGTAAVCATVRGDGPWIGVLVDDDGARDLSAEAVARVVATTARTDQGVADLGARMLTIELPELPTMVWACARADGDVQVLVAVLLDLPADDQGTHRADVLATFAAHAAAVVANVELHQDVQAALERQVELNRQKSEFVAAVSHELRTPLASVLGAIQTVQRAENRLTPVQRAEVLGLGASQGARLRDLIEDLLLVAATEHRSVPIDHTAVDPAVVIDDVVAGLPPATRARIQVDVGRVGGLLSDEDKIRRILLNLVDNAHKYAPEGPIVIGADRAPGTVRFTVDDDGPGILPSDRSRVFERFVQLDGSPTRRHGGTGLGLHLCRELAQLLGGTLTVANAPTGGARFVLELPQRRGQDLVEAVTTSVGTGAEAQLPLSTTSGILTSPLRPAADIGGPIERGAAS